MRRLAQVGLALTTMMVLLVGCNPYNKMQKNVGKIDAYATPEVLALRDRPLKPISLILSPRSTSMRK